MCIKAWETIINEMDLEKDCNKLIIENIKLLIANDELDYIEVYPYMNIMLYGNSENPRKQYETMFNSENELNELLDKLDRLQIDYKEYTGE